MIKFLKKFFLKEININNDIKKMCKLYKISQKFNKFDILKKIFLLLAWREHNKIFYKYSCDISPNCRLGNVIFRHPIGIIIGGGSILEDDVIVHQNVTFGALRFSKEERRGIPCNQIIKKGTIICTGAKILGDVTIGENCIVGANAVVTKDIPDGATVVGYNKIILK